jgi:hypothetical protein
LWSDRCEETKGMAHKDRRPSPLSRVRRLPVAAVMEATQRRRAGDWRGALLAAGFTTDVDLDAVASAYGSPAAERLAGDLAAMAPDLLRQYLSPYRPWTVPAMPAVLTDDVSYGPVLVVVGRHPGGRRGAHLLVTKPERLPRYTRPMPIWTWHADAVDERRTAYEALQPHALKEAESFHSGAIGPGDLHPLVHDALLPGRRWQPSTYAWCWDPVRVRCGANWHEVQVEGGRFVAHAHSDAEIERELTLSGLTGPIVRCAEVVQAWRSGDGRLPKVLRWQRQDFFEAASHGHADAVLAALDAGFDPAAANSDGSTLLHLLPWIGLDLLPRLLSAGLSVNFPDKSGRTPLHWAYADDVPEVIQALLDAGADPTARDMHGHEPRTYTPKLPSMATEMALRPEVPARSLLSRLLGRATA